MTPKRPEHLKSPAARKLAEQRAAKPKPSPSKKFRDHDKHGVDRGQSGHAKRGS